MLFQKQNCPKCNSFYDQCLDVCPSCGHVNESQTKPSYKNKIFWVDFIKQIILFSVGFIGYQLLSFILSFAFSPLYKQDDLLSLMLINLIAYLLIFICLCFCLFKDLPKLLIKTFNKHQILSGVVSGIILIGLSELLTFLFGLIYNGTNVNQQISVNLILRFPAFGIIFLGLIGPIVEEITYRIGLFSFASRINRVFAYIITILIFTLIHIDFSSSDWLAELISLPTYLTAAFILTFTYEKFGPTASIISHSLNNIFSVILILSGAMK